MAPGERIIFDTWRNHRVINADKDERIHLVGDTVGSEGIWDLLNLGRAPRNGTYDGWRTEPVAPVNDYFPELTYESLNVPEVMTPWELQSHLVFLFGEGIPHERLAPAQGISSQLIAKWKPLWAQYGTDHAGLAGLSRGAGSL